MILTQGSVKILAPTDNSQQRIFKIDGITHDFVMIEIDGVIYLNSISEKYLKTAVQYIKVPLHESSTPGNKVYDDTLIDMRGKSRQYQGLTGYLLRTDYKSLKGASQSLAKKLISHKTSSTGSMIHTRLIAVLESI